MNEPKLETTEEPGFRAFRRTSDGMIVGTITNTSWNALRKHLNKGMVERFVVQPKGTEPGYETEAEARSNGDYMFSPPWRIVRILVSVDGSET